MIKGSQEKDREICVEEIEKVKYPGLGDMRSQSMVVSNNYENEEDYKNTFSLNHIVNKRKLNEFSPFNYFIAVINNQSGWINQDLSLFFVPK